MGFPFSKIDSILKDINWQYNAINSGGCGVMAASIAAHLEYFAEEVKIVSCGGYGNIDHARRNINNRNNLDDWESEGIYFNHVWVEFKWRNRWYCADSTGVKSRKSMYRYWMKPSGGSFTLREMKELGNNASGWNRWFDRDQIPSMKNRIGRMFNKLYWQIN